VRAAYEQLTSPASLAEAEQALERELRDSVFKVRD